MPESFQLSIPRNVTEILKDPQFLADLAGLVNALAAPRIVLGTPTQAGGGSALLATKNNAVLTLGLRYPNGVPSNVPGGASLADLIASHNLILAGERATQNPIGQ